MAEVDPDRSDGPISLRHICYYLLEGLDVVLLHREEERQGQLRPEVRGPERATLRPSEGRLFPPVRGSRSYLGVGCGRPLFVYMKIFMPASIFLDFLVYFNSSSFAKASAGQCACSSVG